MKHSSQLSPEELQSLRQNLEQFRLLVENSQDVVAEVSMEGEFLYISPNVKRLLGYEPGELLKRSVFEHVHPEDLAHVQEQFALPEGSAACRYLHKDGSWRWLETSGRDFLAPGGEMRGVLVARDIGERKQAEATRAKLEAQLRQSQKLEAIGTLAGGIAHDFSNILTVIMAYTELASMGIERPEEACQYLGQVRKACDRAKDLVHQILTFSRKQKPERKPMLLQVIIKEALKLLRSTLPATIEMDLQIDPNAPVVLADPTQIHQVMMNLCTNATHAMRDTHGRLTVTLQTCDLDESLVHTMPELHRGRYVKLTVSDTGHGMNEDVLKRIFEPFFTTKGPGEGTGLGLPVVHGIIKDHHGAITVRSRPSEGTTFDLYFPTHKSEVIEASKTVVAPPRGSGERILFVDDEPEICASIGGILEHLGYRVTTQTNPAKALFQFRAAPEKFDLVFADVTMPGMTGADLARRIAQLRPNLPIVLATGSSQSWTTERIQELGIRELVAKPMNPAVLAVTIHRVLHGPMTNHE